MKLTLWAAAAAAVVLGAAGGPKPGTPPELQGFDSEIVVDGASNTPAAVQILVPPGGGEVQKGKTMLIAMVMSNDADDGDAVFIEMPAIAKGSFDVRPFGAPGIVVRWDGK